MVKVICEALDEKTVYQGLPMKLVTSVDERVEFVNTYTAGVELPATGGSGTMTHKISGLALILIAGVFQVSRKR